MSQVQRSLPRTGDRSDVARVVCALRQSGPMSMSELLEHPDLADWPSHRIDEAVVAAWSRDLISIDPRDLLVVL